MASQKQIAAARSNIRKAQAAWKGMSHEEHARAQPQGRGRKKPGSTGEGEYYRIQVRPKGEFVTFRTQDVGDRGHIQRLAGKRESGSWDTQTWLVSKDDAHKVGKKLVPDTADARDLFNRLGSTPMHVKGDVFKAQDRPNVPESAKPTAAQRRARSANIKKAQAARHARKK
ncbi:MAG TPA: hypothetical protein VLM40_21805 [Gemmata sp.]|nr:hypothetical protein [Gemmata sp.]